MKGKRIFNGGTPPRPATRGRGMTLLEIVLAMGILSLVLVGVLQMFSLSLLSNQGSLSRTELTFKAQQVIENIRMAQTIFRNTGSYPAGSLTALSAGNFNVPYYAGDSASVNGGTWGYWGPNGANVMEAENGPYRLAYSVQDGGTSWSITVTATAAPRTPGSRRYLGIGTDSRRIEYVGQVSKS
jgi:type II secretory pathway pseudopilin PulG